MIRTSCICIISIVIFLFIVAIPLSPLHAEVKDVTAMVKLNEEKWLGYDLDNQTNNWDFSLTNISQEMLVGPIRVRIEEISVEGIDEHNIHVANGDGMEAGKYFYEYVTPSGALLPGESTSKKRWSFKNPDEYSIYRFKYKYSIFADTTTPPIENQQASTPSPVEPKDGVEVSMTPLLSTNMYSDPDGDKHFHTEWQISKCPFIDDPNCIVLDISSGTYLTSLQVPDLVLKRGSKYYWRVRFFDERFGGSNWSEVSSFTCLTDTDEGDKNLNGIPDEQELDPNVAKKWYLNGGIPDPNIMSVKVKNSDGKDIEIGIKPSTNVVSIEYLCAIDCNQITDKVNRPAKLPCGLISFKANVLNRGYIGEVIIYLSENDSKNRKWYKYDSINGWQDYSAHAKFSENGREIVLSIKDGGFGDADGVENMMIADPSGVGLASPVPAGSGGCFISATRP